MGLQSVMNVTRKHGGLFRCQWEQERFILRVVLMPPVEQDICVKKKRPNWEAAAVLAGLLCLVILNCVPALADMLETIPVLGWFFRIVDLRTYALVFWRN